MGISCGNPTVFLSYLFLFSAYLSIFSHATSTITQGQLIKDGQTIISPSKNFVLGFFSPGGSTNRYVGIWYNKSSDSLEQTVVWVANRESPIADYSGVITIGDHGNLTILDGSGKSVWSTNASVTLSNSSAILHDNGNLILSTTEDMGHSTGTLWESFDEPTDTFLPGSILPGMKVGWNLRTGKENIYTSWKTASDPSMGNFSMGVDPHGLPEIMVWEQKKSHWRSGQWDGQTFTGVPTMRSQYLYGFKLNNDNQVGKMVFTYDKLNTSDILRIRIKWDGIVQWLRWEEGTNSWVLVWSQPTNECELYNKCGNFASCSLLNSPICSCLQGFEPKSNEEWSSGNWSGGCVRRTLLQCERNSSSLEEVKRDGFFKLDGMKLPDYSVWLDAKNRGECEEKCLKNCSCSAYAYVGGIGCMTWDPDLVDIQQFSKGGNELYIHLSHLELGGESKISKIIIIFFVSGTIFLSTFAYLLWRSKAKLKDLWRKINKESSIFDLSKSREFWADFSGPDDIGGGGNQGNGPELLMFSFNSVAAATGNFSNTNKLGQGGFGPVYKGMLPCGKEIAVKRLSRSSGQGLEEFKTEIILISKLQHRNLVRLLGCCIEGEEKMLVYEHMPNKSLDAFIFDSVRKGLLDWKKRFNIIEGIARGLLYLHRDSRLRIIHRDLKASNILLDQEMNPKISDFGMAKIFEGNQNQANTNRVVGTYGYMSPEYAMGGLFSVKSDVYSFGVILLEIVSGKRNTHFHHSEHTFYLLGYAWQLWTEEKAMEFKDSSISDSCFPCEVLRCIHVGLLCVQDSAADRPTMSSVVLMLGSETATLPAPKRPTFTMRRDPTDMDLCIESPEIISINDVTVTMIVGR